jgi:hypothetical protein
MKFYRLTLLRSEKDVFHLCPHPTLIWASDSRDSQILRGVSQVNLEW